MSNQIQATRKSRQGRVLSAGLRLGAVIGAMALSGGTTSPAMAADATVQPLPGNAPNYFRFTYPSAMRSPLPMKGTLNMPAVVLPSQSYIDPKGLTGSYLTTGPVVTANNAFFQSLGTNGRSCFSCHQPADGMSVSTSTIQRLFVLTGGRDPIFAPVDGSNCPTSVPRTETVVSLLGGIMGGGRQALRESHSLLLNKGLFRIYLPVPTTVQDLDASGKPLGTTHAVEFTISVQSDPYGCNSDASYATSKDAVTQEVRQMISVYRRPRMSGNLKFVTAPVFGGATGIDGVTGQPIIDAATGLPMSGNIMWDGREPTLESQANDATLGHAQATKPPTAKQIAEMVAFENSVYVAQTYHLLAGDLSQNAGAGGPKPMAAATASSFAPTGFGTFSGFPTTTASNASMAAKARASIARGQALFNTKQFTADHVPGFNNAVKFGLNGDTVTTCASCHGNMPSGSDPFPAGQRDIGIGGQAVAFRGPKPATDLPVFKVTCKTGYSTAFYGQVVLTNDPGLALITGRCADVGRRSVPQLRALASRSPYFSDGSAPALEDVVKVYNTRFNIGLLPTEITDLANFLEAL